MRRTRILFVNHVSQMSGGEHGLINTIRRLDRNEFEIAVALPSTGPLSEKLIAAGAEVSVIDICRPRKSWNPALLLKYYISWLRGRRQLTRLIRELSIDIVHANSNTAHIYAGPAATRAGVPCIWHSRDLVRLGPLARWMSSHASRIAVISHAVEKHLIDEGVDPKKIRTIHNVVDTEHFKPSVTPDGDPVVAMVGQMVPWKRHDMFISCAVLILKEVPNATFEIIGGDLFCEHESYAEQLKTRAERELPGKIHFTGYCSTMAAKLEQIAVLLHPARREPFGRTLIEAMAMAKPVVAVDSCGPSEIISHRKDGFLVPNGDIAAMAAWAVELLTDADLARKIGEAARRTVEERFAAATPPEALVSLYKEVIPETAT